MNIRKDDIFKEHKKALLKKTMVVSRFLDNNLKERLESLKYGSSSPLRSDDPYESARRYSMIDLEYTESLKKSPRESYTLCGENDEVNSNSENNDELFSSTVDSSEFLATPGSNKEDSMKSFPSGRRLSKSRMSEFACNLSKEGQYALLKSLEDTLLHEVEANHSDLAEKLPLGRRNELSSRKKCNYFILKFWSLLCKIFTSIYF